MKTQNRKTIYSQDQEDLAVLLANKSRDDIYDIIEGREYVMLPTLNHKYTAIQRANNTYNPFIFYSDGY